MVDRRDRAAARAFVDSSGGFVSHAFCAELLANETPKVLVEFMRDVNHNICKADGSLVSRAAGAASAEAAAAEATTAPLQPLAGWAPPGGSGPARSGGRVAVVAAPAFDSMSANARQFARVAAEGSRAEAEQRVDAALHVALPGSQAAPAAMELLRGVLAQEGFRPENSLLVTSCCPCDPGAALHHLAGAGAWRALSIGGAGGLPALAGGCPREFSALVAAHVPDGGRLVVMYGPHIGVHDLVLGAAAAAAGGAGGGGLLDGVPASGRCWPTVAAYQTFVRDPALAVRALAYQAAARAPDRDDDELLSLLEAVQSEFSALAVSTFPQRLLLTRLRARACAELQAALAGVKCRVALVGLTTVNTPPGMDDRVLLSPSDVHVRLSDGRWRAPSFARPLSAPS